MSDSGTASGIVGCTFECSSSSAEWAVLGASITEELNRPYQISLSLSTSGAHADATEMLGESCTVTLERDGETTAYAAVIHCVEDTAEGDLTTTVSVQASAALGLLSHNRQTRIFQDQSVPEILDAVLEEGLGQYDRTHKSELNGDYPKCEYRLQYDESDLAFCSRLMEEEGIAYRFDRSDADAEVLLLTDDAKGSSGDTLSTEFAGDAATRERVQDIAAASSLRPTKLSLKHFNWTNPSLPIEEEKEGDAKGAVRETYHHDRLPPTLHEYSDGDGYKSNDAKAQCQIRRELDASEELVLQGSGNVIGFSAGACFELAKHALEGEYLLTSVNHSFSGQSAFVSYTNGFTCIPADTPYRPARETPKPRVPGLETAIVVGPSGQEIHTDKHGRIKVQFHWDREGKNDDHSSCFIRVVQPWAGAGWGFVFLPRIGMEVTVAFVQGDPDRPIVTGTLYNGENPTPYEMPDEMTKSTIRTQSSPGGDGYNELTFEDKADEEEVFLQAQKNLRELVKNDHSTDIGNDQTLDVENDQSTTIGNDQSLEVGNNQTSTIGKDQTLDVGENQSISIGGDKSVAVTGNFEETVDKDHNQSVGGSTTEDVGKDRSLSVGDDWTADAGKNISINSGKDTSISADGAMNIKVAKDLALGVDKKASFKIADELTIKVGKASITMKKNGDITIDGGKINIKGQSDVVIKGSKTSIN